MELIRITSCILKIYCIQSKHNNYHPYNSKMCNDDGGGGGKCCSINDSYLPHVIF